MRRFPVIRLKFPSGRSARGARAVRGGAAVAVAGSAANNAASRIKLRLPTHPDATFERDLVAAPRRKVMPERRWGWRYGTLAALCALVSLLLAACGSSSSSRDPNTLLKQTFSGPHQINSGDLDFKLTITPTGSSTLHTPITVEFGGPFQSRGTGKLPQSNFAINVTAQGRSTSLGILSTGTAGYVVLDGASYQLPQATFQRLESSFSQVASPSSSGSSSGTLGKFGIQPLSWLTTPTIVGTENVGGASTTHIRAGVNVTALVNGFSRFLQKASGLGVSGTAKFPAGLSASTRSHIASEIQNPSFDVWTGREDKTMRRLQLGLTIPVSGKVSTAFGGLSSATFGLRVQYSNLNQPETIAAPRNVQPYSEFQSRLQSVLQALSGGAVGSASASGSGTGSASSSATTTTTPSSSSAGSGQAAYSQCIQSAGGDIAKMQQCGALLGSQ